MRSCFKFLQNDSLWAEQAKLLPPTQDTSVLPAVLLSVSSLYEEKLRIFDSWYQNIYSTASCDPYAAKITDNFTS